MAKGQKNNNYLNENHELFEDINKIKRIDSYYKSIGLTSNPQQILEQRDYWYYQHDIFNILRGKVDIGAVDIMVPTTPGAG